MSRGPIHPLLQPPNCPRIWGTVRPTADVRQYRAQIAQRLEKLLDSGKLKSMFGKGAEAEAAHDSAVRLLRNKMDSLLEFRAIRKF